MASTGQLSPKRLQIDKASTTIVAVLAVASFLVVFSIVAGKALLSQRSYQARVIAKKEKARDQLRDNIDASGTLINSYKTFIGTSQNVIGGNPSGAGEKDGDNAKIILDALPSQYDYPALTTSLDKLITGSSIKFNSITGIDDLSQQKNSASSTPTAVPMPFEVNITGSYKSIQDLITVFEHSIRPFQIISINLTGKDNELTVILKAQSFYQPEKDLSIKTEVVR